MRFGFHVSIGGGLANAVSEAKLRKCQTIQIFSRNPQGWKYKELDPDQVARFRQGIRENDICPVTVHMPYLANIASPNKALYRRSNESVAVDLNRCARIGAQYLVIHLGRNRALGEDELVSRMAQAIDAAYRRAVRGAPSAELPKLLLENTAGMGTEFRQLKGVIESAANPNRLGVVLDTAHLFEAGWDLRTADGLNRMLREFDATVGMKRLYLLHLNDSKTDFGSRLDRHWHIGQGKIGREGFRHIVNHPLLSHLPGIMETPRLGIREDRMNLRAIRTLIAPERRPTGSD
jgi:deoxyribonuclease-4